MNVSIGIDEAGLGPIAGPAVFSVVVLPSDVSFRGKVRDSKKLNEPQREELVDDIWSAALFYKTLVIEPHTIDDRGVSAIWTDAVRMLAEMAHERFPSEQVVLDGNRLVGLDYVLPIVKADDKFLSVSAASILSKYTQCCWMDDYHVEYPDYRFDQHRGYATQLHIRKLEEFGPCPAHRKSTGPVKKVLRALSSVCGSRPVRGHDTHSPTCS